MVLDVGRDSQDKEDKSDFDFGFRFEHSEGAGQGLDNTKRIETASVVVAVDESGDFQSIQEAINSLDNKGGYIQLKEGDFISKSKINIPSNVTIEGTGFNTRVIRTTNGHIFENRDITAGNENIAIKNIRFRGTNIGSNAATRLKNCTNCQIEGIQTEQLFYALLIQESKRCYAINNISIDSNLGNALFADGCFDCQFIGNNLFGENVSIDLNDCENCLIANNICNDAGDIGISIDTQSNRNLITGNQAADSANIGINCEGDYNVINGNCAEGANTTGIIITATGTGNIVTSNLATVSNSGTSTVVANNVAI